MRILFFLFFIIAAVPLSAQSGENSTAVCDTFRVRPDNRYYVKAIAVVEGSEEIYIRGRLLPRNNYQFFYSFGYFSISDSVPYSVFDTIIVKYRTLLISLKKEYRLRELVYMPAANKTDSLLFSRRVGEVLSTENIFGSSIEKSGTLIRGFTVGSTRDLTLQSGLRLQLSGKLTDDIEVIAALTDENSPLQPEGNTERLDELDKVYIQLKHKNATATFGDYDFQKQTGEFGGITRKLQGLSLEGRYNSYNGFAAFASSRGKFSSNSFNGTDAVQGPYLLYGANSEKDIIVIAGSERVFLDGEALRRGEQNDYTIDYGNAQLTFTTRKLITSASRVIVEFEYTDRQYSRTFVSAGAGAGLIQDRLKLSVHYAREADDQNNPIDLILSDAEKESLKNAGDDRSKATTTGITLVPPDSDQVRRGTYEPVDTSVNGNPLRYYRYNPGAAAAEYNLVFSYTGERRGDYIRTGPGKFTFAGISQGNYNPVRFLPLPEQKEALAFSAEYKINSTASVTIDGAASNYDRNRFSTEDDRDNAGGAISFLFKAAPSALTLHEMKLGKAGGFWKERFIHARYVPMERFGEVEFNRTYNVQQTAQKTSERFREVSFEYIPVEKFTFGVLYGGVTREDVFKSNRYRTTAKMNKFYGSEMEYEAERISSSYPQAASDWLRQSGQVKYADGIVHPVFRFRHERKSETLSGDSLLGSSLKYIEIEPGIEIAPISQFQFSVDYFRRADESARKGRFVREAVAEGWGAMSTLTVRGLSSTLRVSSRDKRYTDEFLIGGMTNSRILLIKSQTRFSPLRQFSGDIFYEASSQKTSLLDRVFIEVRKGQGNYRYLGDLNNNGVKDEAEFEPALYDGEYVVVTVPSDKLYPVVDLKTSARLRYNIKDIFEYGGLSALLLEPFTFESYGRIEENSTLDDVTKIYLLRQKYFRDPVTTIRGNDLFQQTVSLFENSNDFSLRFFFSQLRSLNRYGSGTETGYRREQSLLARFQLVAEMSGTVEMIRGNDNVYQKTNPLRNRNIESSTVKLVFSYRPVNFIESGVKIQAGRNTDMFPEKPTVVDDNSQQIYVQIAFSGAGRLRVEAERVELTAGESSNYLPFEMTSGNGIGKNYFIRMNFDYRIAANLQMMMNYDGRALAGSNFIHTFRGEARAFF